MTQLTINIAFKKTLWFYVFKIFIAMHFVYGIKLIRNKFLINAKIGRNRERMVKLSDHITIG